MSNRMILFKKLMERSCKIGGSGFLCSPLLVGGNCARLETVAGSIYIEVDDFEVEGSVVEGYVIEWDVERYEERTAREAVERVYEIVKEYVIEMAADELWAEAQYEEYIDV